MPQAESTLPIVVATVSGLFALLGGLCGAWLARRTEHGKWLRQERSAAFAEFLRQLHAVREKSLDIIYSKDLAKLEKNMKVTELFAGLNSQENIVRLYLKSADRDKFTQVKHGLWLLHSSIDDQTQRIQKVEGLLSEIQSLFEKTIHG